MSPEENKRFAQAELAANRLLIIASDIEGDMHVRYSATAYEWLVVINQFMATRIRKNTKRISDLTWAAHFYSQLADNLHLLAMAYRVAHERKINLP